jgi:TPR repeat protein
MKEADFIPEDSSTYRGRELALARYHFAMLLIDGNGIAQDVARAIPFLRYASDHDCGVATNQLARMRQLGLGLARDDATAVRLYQAAGSSGVGAAAFDLAGGYAAGRRAVD